MLEFFTNDFGSINGNLYFTVKSTFECQRSDLKEKLGELVQVNGEVYKVLNINLHATMFPIYVGRLLGLVVEPYIVELPFVVLADRYLKILHDELKKSYQKQYNNKKITHLTKMLKAGLDHVEEWPTEKLYNWLGYVAGCMECLNLINVKEERDFSRPIYHAYYKSKNIKIPETLDLEEY